MAFQLQGQRVLIKENPKEYKTVGGIFIPEASQSDRNTGTVVAIGNEVPDHFDKRQVLFNKNARVPMTYNGTECILVYVFDIIATLD